MTLLEGQVENQIRFLIAEPSTRRFTQAMIAQQISNAQVQIATEIDHPEAIRNFVITNARLYQMPELIKVKRCYIVTLNEDGSEGAQQPLFGTDPYTLEGIIQEYWDNTSGVIQGNPIQSPQWLEAQPRVYPVNGPNIGGRIPTKSPYGHNSRPSYFFLGGYIGIVPPPAPTMPNTVLKVVYVPVPPAVNRSTDPLLLPSIMLDAICYKVCQYIKISDNSSQSADFERRYNMEINDKIRPWLQSIQANRPKQLVPVTRRDGRRRGGRW